MGGYCNYCGEELEGEEIEIDNRFYCSKECIRNERLDYEAERGLAMQERRERDAEFLEYDDGVF